MLAALDQESVVLRRGPRSGSDALWPLSSRAGGDRAQRYDPEVHQPRVLFCGEFGSRRGFQRPSKVSSGGTLPARSLLLNDVDFVAVIVPLYFPPHIS